jgi:hypothetical protein
VPSLPTELHGRQRLVTTHDCEEIAALVEQFLAGRTVDLYIGHQEFDHYVIKPGDASVGAVNYQSHRGVDGRRVCLYLNALSPRRLIDLVHADRTTFTTVVQLGEDLLTFSLQRDPGIYISVVLRVCV